MAAEPAKYLTQVFDYVWCFLSDWGFIEYSNISNREDKAVELFGSVVIGAFVKGMRASYAFLHIGNPPLYVKITAPLALVFSSYFIPLEIASAFDDPTSLKIIGTAAALIIALVVLLWVAGTKMANAGGVAYRSAEGFILLFQSFRENAIYSLVIAGMLWATDIKFEPDCLSCS
ncbi:MAG: hypothetical protein AAF936_03875 [Pseudomonadota bacterium]